MKTGTNSSTSPTWLLMYNSITHVFAFLFIKITYCSKAAQLQSSTSTQTRNTSNLCFYVMINSPLHYAVILQLWQNTAQKSLTAANSKEQAFNNTILLAAIRLYKTSDASYIFRLHHMP